MRPEAELRAAHADLLKAWTRTKDDPVMRLAMPFLLDMIHFQLQGVCYALGAAPPDGVRPLEEFLDSLRSCWVREETKGGRT